MFISESLRDNDDALGETDVQLKCKSLTSQALSSGKNQGTYLLLFTSSVSLAGFCE